MRTLISRCEGSLERAASGTLASVIREGFLSDMVVGHISEKSSLLP